MTRGPVSAPLYCFCTDAPPLSLHRCSAARWYNKCLSPDEFPLKPGQWKRFLKKSKEALEAARARAPCRPGEKPAIRKKKVRGR